MLASNNLLGAARMVLTVLCKDALRTLKASRIRAQVECVLLDDGSPQRNGFIGQGAAPAEEH